MFVICYYVCLLVFDCMLVECLFRLLDRLEVFNSVALLLFLIFVWFKFVSLF